MPHEFRRTDPSTYRFQIREHTRVPLDDAGERHEYGAVLWDDDDPRRLLRERTHVAMRKADKLAETHALALGVVAIKLKDGPFQGVYFARPNRVATAVPQLRVIAGGAR